MCSLKDMLCFAVQHMLEHSWAFFQKYITVPAAGEKV